MRVLIVEDDPPTAKAMELMLRSEGFNVYTTELGEEAVELARGYDYDVISLDLNLPDISGLAVLRQIRGAGLKVPILICSGTTDLDTKVKTLGGGADDYLTKPFHKDELVARLRALIRRSQGHAESVVKAGPLTIHLDRRVADVDGALIHLTGKEWQMLELLALRKGRAVSKDVFMTHLYGGMDEPEIKIIDVFVSKLRKKLAEAGAGHVIDTAWGCGYSLTDKAARPMPPMGRHGAARARDTDGAIIALLAGGQRTADSMAQPLSVTRAGVYSRLRGLVQQGHVRVTLRGGPRVGPSTYALTDAGQAVAAQAEVLQAAE
jgi:two-component system cell cycle response regulator CtrA